MHKASGQSLSACDQRCGGAGGLGCSMGTSACAGVGVYPDTCTVGFQEALK